MTHLRPDPMTHLRPEPTTHLRPDPTTHLRPEPETRLRPDPMTRPDPRGATLTYCVIICCILVSSELTCVTSAPPRSENCAQNHFPYGSTPSTRVLQRHPEEGEHDKVQCIITLSS
ncbi:unnamed protein product [Boreogadus saida]